MNIRFIAASAIALGVLTSGAFAGNSDYITSSTYGLSDAEATYAIGRVAEASPIVAEVAAQAFAVDVQKFGGGDYIDESAVESNQRTSNR